MATVTGFTGIATDRLGWMVPTRNLKIVEVTPDSLTVKVAKPANAGVGGWDGNFVWYGGECTYYGSFEVSNAKALSRGTVTSIESVWNWSPWHDGPQPMISIDGLDLTLGAIQKGDFPLILAGDDTITGSAGIDDLFGHAGDDVIDGREGDDQLDGGTGADLMRGGPGYDSHVVDDPGDRVVERAGEGQDTVQSSVSFTLPEHVEALRLAGAAEAGVGNALANDISGNPLANRLEGLAGDDRLDGGPGADTMLGGPGDDSYMVDDRGDLVVELPDAGVDTIETSIALVLPDHVENLVLLDAARSGTGNALANRLAGNDLKNLLVGGDGDDVLIGAGGKDTLEGGEGADRFVWEQDTAGLATIRDFSRDDRDVLDLRDLVGDYEPGVSLAGDFLRLAVGRKATKVSLDPDGSDGAAKFQVLAVLTGFDGTGVSVDSLVDEGSILLA